MSLFTRMSPGSGNAYANGSRVQADRDNNLGSYFDAPASHFVGLNQWTFVNPLVGDYVVIIAEMRDYVLRPGETEFNPVDVQMAPGFRFVESAVVRRGGDPRLISKLFLIFAGQLTPEMLVTSTGYYGTAVQPWRFRFPTWKLPKSPVNEAAGPAPHWGYVCSYIFRGETAITDVSIRYQLSPSGSVTAGPGWSPGAGMAVFTAATIGDSQTDSVNTHDAVGASTSTMTASQMRFSYTASGYAATPIANTGVGLAVSVGTAVVPLQPLVTSPLTGQWRDFANRGLVIDYTYRAGLAGPQLGYYLNRTIAGQTGLTYWNQDTATWQATAYLNPWFEHRVTLPPGFMANGLQATFQLSTVSTSGVASKPCDAFTVYGIDGPTAQVQIVGASSGQVADMTPSVQVTGTPGTDLAVIDGYRAWMYDNLTGDLLASITADGTARWDPGVMLVDGQQIRVEAQSRQTGGEYSPTVTAIATVNVTVPPAPRINATPTYEPQTGLPGIKVDVTWPTSTFDWSAGGVKVTLQRSSTEHPEPTKVATYVTAPGESGFTVYDYAAPTGQASRYTGQATATTPDGGFLVGQYGTSSDVYQDDECSWLLDPTDPTGAVRVGIVDAPEIEWGRRSAHEMLGRPDVLISSAGSGLYGSGSMKLETDTIDEAHRVRTLLDSDRRLFLRWCGETDRDDVTAHEDVWFEVSGRIRMYRSQDGPTATRGFAFDVALKPPLVQA